MQFVFFEKPSLVKILSDLFEEESQIVYREIWMSF